MPGIDAHSLALAVGTEILRVEDLTVHFLVPGRSVSVEHTVDVASFAVRQGASFGIVGEVGSGKSTTAQG